MVKSVPSNATPAMLKWARLKAPYSVKDAASHLGVEPELIEQWERGEGTPSLPRLEKLAALYKRTTPFFYLPEPPTDFSPVHLRTLPNGGITGASPDFVYVIRRSHELQQWIASALEDADAEEIDFVGSASRPTNAVKHAIAMRARLGIGIFEQTATGTAHKAFELWRSRCEEIGVFVFQTTKIDLEEMRGFALPHKIAPVVMVNGTDPAAAKSFTLLHEMGHIVLGMAAITKDDPYSVTQNEPQAEQFCNRFAAEILVPREDFVPRVPSDWETRDDEILRDLSDFYRVSRAMIAFRLVETGFAETRYFFRKLPMLTANKGTSSGGPPRTVSERTVTKLGTAFCRLAVSEFQAGRIHGGELTSLMHMSLKHLPELESQLFLRRVPY